MPRRQPLTILRSIVTHEHAFDIALGALIVLIGVLLYWANRTEGSGQQAAGSSAEVSP